ncbi:hypothetical protein [Vibrio marisflavi]|uniref:Lipoprotein n=1 Tax=Vibrio marisflavi CECT 7928 TaxID=634439 RepID=A0ABM8ZYB1_9VIBR|nr:hypothetical protein [Vibrio marisflavi]CAH0535883.1 hypothetical protein VMF7928_00033 [Vibrio marisflavi CECT 7928]
MLRCCFVAMTIILLAGCTEHQANEMGIGNGTVTNYPQNMTNMELCQTLYFSRPTTQTRVAVASEFDRRKLDYSSCKAQYDENFLSAFIKQYEAQQAANSSDSSSS